MGHEFITYMDSPEAATVPGLKGILDEVGYWFAGLTSDERKTAIVDIEQAVSLLSYDT